MLKQTERYFESWALSSQDTFPSRLALQLVIYFTDLDMRRIGRTADSDVRAKRGRPKGGVQDAPRQPRPEGEHEHHESK